MRLSLYKLIGHSIPYRLNMDWSIVYLSRFDFWVTLIDLTNFHSVRNIFVTYSIFYFSTITCLPFVLNHLPSLTVYIISQVNEKVIHKWTIFIHNIYPQSLSICTKAASKFDVCNMHNMLYLFLCKITYTTCTIFCTYFCANKRCDNRYKLCTQWGELRDVFWK